MLELITKHPRNVNLSYLTALNKLNTQYFDEFIDKVKPILSKNQSVYAIADSKDALLNNIWNIIDNVYTLFADDYIKRVASSFVNNMLNYEAKNGVASKIITIDPKQLISQFNLQDEIANAVNENVNLIKTIPDKLFDDVKATIEAEFTNGTSCKNLVKKLNTIKPQQRWKLERIARTETAKLNTTINRAQAQQLGQTSFIWLTANDERTCPICAPRNNQEYPFNDLLPGFAHPNCRCQMKFKL